MKSLNRLVILGLLLAGTISLCAQYTFLEVDQIESTPGSPKPEIHAVLLDSRGLLWIGSQGGLAYYDGYRVTSCPLDGMDVSAGADRSVRSLHEDARGRLWLATAQGLACYDPNECRATWFRHDPRRQNSLGHDDLTCLQVLPANPGRLWVASRRGTLDEIDLDSGDVTRRLAQPSSTPSDLGRIHALYGNPRGVLWIGAESGLFRYLPLDNRLRHCPIPAAILDGRAPPGITAIFFDPGVPDALWIGSDGPGLFRYYPAGDSWQQSRKAGASNALPSETVIHAIALYPEERHSLIIGTNEGLYRFDPGSGDCRRIMPLENRSEMLPSRCTRLLNYDRLGNCWIGTCRDGLAKWSPWEKTFSSFHPPSKNINTPFAGWITSIKELDRGGILLTTAVDGAFIFDPASQAFRSLVLDPAAPDRDLNSNNNNFFIGRGGTLWFSTGEGLARCSPAGRLQRLYPYGQGCPEVENPQVWMVIQDAAGILWLATSQGLMRFDPESGAWSVSRHDPHDPRSLSHDRVYYLVEEAGGAIWVGTDNGLNLYQPGENRFTVFKNDPAVPTSLSDNFVYYLARDSRDRIWVCTGNGLNLVQHREGRIVFQHYLVPGGERSQNFFTSMVEESSRHFWLGSRSGLARFDSQEGTFTCYDRRDGIMANGMNDLYIGCRSRNGEIFFAGRSGLTSFRYDPADINPHPPPLILTGFQPGGGSGNADAREPFLFLMPGSTLRVFTTNGLASLSLEFAALDFVRPDKNQYAFRLDGRDKDWIHQGTDRVVRLNGLQPGRYALRVKAANNDGVWNENGMSLEIEVSLPFWRPWRIALLAGFLLAGAGFYLVWIRRQRRRWMTQAVIPTNLDAILERFSLSKREGEILRLLLAGKSNKEIEEALFIAMATVKIHVHKIFRKMKVNSRMQLMLSVQQEAKKSP